MARLKLIIPSQFSFTTQIPVRITDVNYGGHVGNDAILSIIHEARMQYLQANGYSEISFEGAGLIMSDVAIDFKNEVFYGDTIIAHVTANDFAKVGFDIVYKLEKIKDDKTIPVALAKTGMVCYDYQARRIAAVPEVAAAKLSAPLS
ncbi:acyl-CoA thioesterase [Terrimonas rubra]|uniref:Acyl-CoA thioesterase n=1 Tax=Terrimonas rubra TaxID=1035890 RepID=A0ABW6A6R5_9BACT